MSVTSSHTPLVTRNKGENRNRNNSNRLPPVPLTHILFLLGNDPGCSSPRVF